MEHWLRDIRSALRTMRRRPGFATIVVLTLGLGIGATTGIFSLVYGILIRPLPYPDEDRLVGFWFEVPTPSGPDRTRQSEATYVHFRRHAESFESFGLIRSISATYQDAERPIRIAAATVTPSLFEVLRINPSLGRPLREEDGLPGAEPVAVLTNAFWASRFGGRDVIGETIEVDGIHRRVIGVLGEGIRFPNDETDLWIPHIIDKTNPNLGTFFYEGYGRLKPGYDLHDAEADVSRLTTSLSEAYPSFFRPQLVAQIRPLFIPLKREITGDSRAGLWVLFAASLAVLAIATANVASLFLVRADGRTREVALRYALGANRSSVVRHMIAETLVLTVFGTGVGLALASAGLRILKLSGVSILPRLPEVALNGPVIGFAGLIAVFVALAAGAAPSWKMTSRKIADSTKSSDRLVGDGRSKGSLRNTLVVGQVALAMILLVGSGLLIRSFRSLHATDLGFESRDVVGMRVALPRDGYAEWPRVSSFYRQLLDDVRQVPGVQRAATASYLPLRDGRVFRTWEVEGYQRAPDEIPSAYLSKVVSEDYFALMEIPLLGGRTLTGSDHAREADPPIIVNATFAQRNWPGENAIGKRVRSDENDGWYTVVGVVGDVRDEDITQDPLGIVYLPMLQRDMGSGLNWREMSLALKGVNSEAMVHAVRDRVNALDPKLPVFDVRTMQETTRDATARIRFTMLLLIIAATSSLFLGAVGLYGVLAYVVGQRKREIGLRMALGSSGSRVRRLVVGRAMLLTGLGIVCGAVGALAGGSAIDAMLFGVSRTDPLTFGAVSIIMLAISWVAASIPAYRASAIDPVLALKND